MENYLRSAGCIIYEFIMLKRRFKDEYTLEVNNGILKKTISGLDKSFGLKAALNL
jgi:hypothetical protein